ncbi:6562_t:CDS:2, partial [Diversispora eburnea]
SKFAKINDKIVNKKDNSNNGKFRKYMPSLFGKNKICKYNYNVEIVCPPLYGCVTDFRNNNNKKVSFCEVVEVGSAIQSYDRRGQLYGIRKDEEIDIWFIGETHVKTQYNLTQEVNTSLYEIKKNSGVWGQGEECRL